jgi:hypothetical protein
MAIQRYMKQLKNIAGWSLAGLALAYVLVAAAIGAIAR